MVISIDTSLRNMVYSGNLVYSWIYLNFGESSTYSSAADRAEEPSSSI